MQLLNNKVLKLIIAAFLMQACTTVVLNESDLPDAQDGADLLECCLETSGTRASLSQDNQPVWDADDKISVLSAAGKNKQFSLVSGDGTASGTFRGTLPAGNILYALYPYSSTNILSSGSIHFSMPQARACSESRIAPESNVMVCSFQSHKHTLSFKNVFGILKLQLSGTATIGRIELTSLKNDDMLWGDFSLAVNGSEGTNSQSLSVSNGSNVCSISFSKPIRLVSGAVKPFYFILPAGTLSRGYCVDIYDGSDNLIYTVTTTKDQTISRSAIKVMDVLDDVNRPVDADLETDPFSWAAYNNLARTGTADQTVIDPQTSGYPSAAQRQDRYAGMFYFIWHTSWSGAGRLPHDNQAILGAGNYGYNVNWNFDGSSACNGVPHHWGRSYLDYYRDDDAWVLRKQAQMLSDAGIDFICFDVTNNAFYINDVLKLLRVWREVRNEGGKTPRVTFMIWHSKGSQSGSGSASYTTYNHDTAVTTLYNNIYASHPEYSDMWFEWEGKPLMLAMGEQVTNPTVRSFFTFRRSWYLWNNNWQTDVDANDPWWQGSTEDKWPWGCAYTDNTTNTMKAGTHNGVNECVSVSPATHPVSNIGRSFQIGNDWQSYKNHPGNPNYPKEPARGIYFKQQFAAAKELDPKVIFFTGWNEYLVGHATAPTDLQFPYMCGSDARGHALFIDQYNNEFSRDIEPIAGDFGDNYYYYLVDFIRQFKGVEETPEYSKMHYVSIDGKFADWLNVESCFADDKGDTKWRGYDTNNGNGWYGFDTNTIYTNKTGRNDLKVCKVACDGTNLYFYVDAVGDLTGYSEGNTGLNLFINTGSEAANWEGFNYKLEPTSATTANLYISNGGWAWTRVSGDISIAVNGKCMEVCLPASLIGVRTDHIKLDFKWVDHVDLSAVDGIQRCMRDGDSAPNGRFRYRYVFNKTND